MEVKITEDKYYIDRDSVLNWKDWNEAGKPKMWVFIRTLKTPKGIYSVWEDVAYGMIKIGDAIGQDMIYKDDLLVLGPYFTGDKVQVYKEVK